MPPATPAAQPNVRSEAVDEPFVAAAGVRSPQLHDVAEHELDDFLVSGRH
jgi:hypothetical protein